MTLEERWDAQADAWARWVRSPGGDPWHARFNWPSFRELLPPPGRLTLDLGCGEGRGGVLLRELGHRMVGVDAAPKMVAHARETGAYEALHVASAAALPLGNGSVDLVVAFMSLHDLDDLEGALRESARVLAPGGTLCAAIVHPFASHQADAPYFEERRYAEPHADPALGITFHSVHRTLETYLETLVGAGLRLEALREPRPSPEVAAAVPRLAKARDRPAFLHLRARR